MVLTDTCGTGGDGSGTFNISTAAAFVACGAGVAVAKHGNRSVTSRSGSADVFEALGIPVSMPPDRAAAALAEVGICFLYAPDYHPAFKGVGPVRRELGFRTVFNMIGPMLNPAGVACQVMGVFAPEMTVPVAEVLGRLGVRHALVVHGSDGLDEFTLTGPSRVTEYKEGWLRTFEFDPQDHGFEYCTPADLKGGDAAENAGIIRRVLEGVGGPHRNIVVINAAAAILAAGIATDFPGALALARASIDSGSALARLESLVRFSAGGGG
jgi:anthranilate phosphoribosyltransferase